MVFAIGGAAEFRRSARVCITILLRHVIIEGHTMQLVWVESAGGPLILLEEHLLASWRGCFSPPEAANDVTDYDRACGVDDYLGTIAVASGYGLVLGDEPMRTTWWQLPEAHTGILVRWQWAASEHDVITALTSLTDVIWAEAGINLHISDGNLVLFDAACVGNEVDERVRIALAPGHYVLTTAQYTPNSSLSLLLHRVNLGDRAEQITPADA